MSFAVISFYKYICKRLCDQSFMLCIQIINNMEMYSGVSTSPPPLSSAMSNDHKNIYLQSFHSL